MSGLRAHIVRIGNSQGIRIPKAVLAKCRLEGEVELDPREDGLVIRPVPRVREGWGEAFRAMAAAGDDTPIEGADTETEWERGEWEW